MDCVRPIQAPPAGGSKKMNLQRNQIRSANECVRNTRIAPLAEFFCSSGIDADDRPESRSSMPALRPGATVTPEPNKKKIYSKHPQNNSKSHLQSNPGRGVVHLRHTDNNERIG